MGSSASLFYSSNDRENTLDWRIQPSDDQYDKQQERWNDLAAYLRDELRMSSGKPIRSWLQGSYKFSTQIRPPSAGEEFDIDLGIYFQWDGLPCDGDHEPDALKAFVQDALESYAADPTNDSEGVSDPKPRCNRIHFADSFHIDVPSYHLDAGRDARALATENGEWEASDPKAIYQWWKDSLEGHDRQKGRRIVRYLKMWAALRFPLESRPSSIMLTVLAAAAYLEADSQELSGDDELLSAVLRKIDERLRKSQEVANPVDRTENLNRLSNDDSEAMLNAFQEALEASERALAAATRTESAEIWSELFSHFFPAPPEEEVQLLKSLSEGRSVAVIAFDPIVSIQATVGGRAYKGLNEIGPVPKGCDLLFTLANAPALPPGASVTWTIRNSGREAEEQNDLGHLSGEGLSTQEHSAYRGTHYVDVAVKLGRQLIGRRRVPVKINSLGVALRNPPKQDWVRFRNRRR